ncbi:MAG: polysaccharide deacetylase family protein, partial [Planctomycetaceae bacterium]
MCRKTLLTHGLVVLLMLIYTSKLTAQGNRLAHLAENNPYHVGLESPKLITPQWVGEKGVEAVVILAIDDMRDPARYEAFLRPVLQRLKKIDGRAPVSIMTNSVRPDDPQLQSWLGEGLSIEVHTIDHPCPLLGGGDLARAKSTYDRCVDLLSKIPGNRPVAFRMPCCDSLNTVSPRFFSEIFNRTTPAGRYLQIDTSVFNVFTSDDPD